MDAAHSQPTPEQLQQTTEELLDHFKMICGATIAATTIVFEHGHALADSCLAEGNLEAYIPHARRLIRFAYPADDVAAGEITAVDYFRDRGFWARRRPAVNEKVVEAFERFQRPAAPRTTFVRWNMERLTNALVIALKDFVEFAPRDLVNEEFAKFVSEWDVNEIACRD